ncbi:NDR1/HIN1-like protein 6 [Silene latifolia]|uniref:NDR1/HIN1-like protein 6 n=1 Tax=Silene latifolia TaxID=37657 RepID=UPI003D785196
MMYDHQRIHPAPDVEAQSLPPPSPPQSASKPLIPTNLEKSDSVNHQFPPPPTRTLPSNYPPPGKPTKRRHSCCCRVFCCIFCLIIFLIIAIGATIGILFLVFHPKIPKYSIDSLMVTQFAPDPANDSLTASFAVNVTAYNPNKHIGILYLRGSHLSAWYRDTLLCQGALPVFYQGHRNTTVINVPLTGTVNNATGMVATLQQDQSQRGNIPLVLTANVPIKVKLGLLKTMKLRFKVHCDLTIDNLVTNQNIRVSSSNCKIKLRRLF